MKIELISICGKHLRVPRYGKHEELPYKITRIENHMLVYAYDNWTDTLYLDIHPEPLYPNDFFKQGWDLC